MSKFSYTMKNLFKSKEERELEAKMQFLQNKKAFERYYRELNASIQSYSKMARDAELSGNHENALSCVKFIAKLRKTQVKVQALTQRFEMMYSMQKLGFIMSSFSKACANMGFNLDTTINLKGAMKDMGAMDKALAKLDSMSDLMDNIFETIDSGLASEGMDSGSSEAVDAEADRMLDQIMGRNNAIHFPTGESASTAGGSAAAAEPVDDTDEILKRLEGELKI